MSRYILALDQGTTSSRAILYNEQAQPVQVAQQEFQQYFPQPGWVEHDAEEIWQSQKQVMLEAIATLPAGSELAGIGITNQRETTVIWHRQSGLPIHPAIVWQDRRTATYCEELKAAGHYELINSKTGLLPDAYFSATKIKWLLDNVAGAREQAANGELAFGTIDSWLVWNLTGGKLHITDVSNASRTMLFNIHTLEWDSELLALFDIPTSLLPEVKPSSQLYGHTTLSEASGIALAGIAGDQQAALFGQLCWQPGMAKCTYGTGCFLVLNTGNQAVQSAHQLLTTIGWQIGDEVQYALEGSVFVGGAVVQWLRDGLQLIGSAAETEALAASVPDSDGVVFVPALTGLGAPYWDPDARGSIFGITRGTTKAHLTRAALDSIAHQVDDLLVTMAKDMGQPVQELRVDGGATANNLLMQIQADISDVPVCRPQNLETTALGAAFLAGLATGVWSKDTLTDYWQEDRTFTATTDAAAREVQRARWHKAVERSKKWV